MQHTLLSGSSHPRLAKGIAAYLEADLGACDIIRFPDDEVLVDVQESVRGSDVFVIQSIARKPNDYLMELLIMIDALKRASAHRIIPVIPYFGYARQDRRGMERVSITAKLVADLLERAGAAGVLTMDLHAEQIQGFFNIPVDNLLGRPLFVSEIKELKLKQPIVVAPDAGSAKIARDFAEALSLSYAIVDKRRTAPDRVEATTLIGDVKGCDVILTDDLCSTGSTLVAAAKACKKAGAGRIVAVISHGLFVGEALECIEESPIELLLVSDTVPGIEEIADEQKKIRIVSGASLFGEAIKRMVSDHSIASLFVK